MAIKLGMDERWVQLAMEMVCTTSYSIQVNREPKGFVQPTRGIKQRSFVTKFISAFCRGVIRYDKKSIKKLNCYKEFYHVRVEYIFLIHRLLMIACCFVKH